MPTAEIQVEKVTTKEGKNSKGPWTRYGIKSSDGVWFNTFRDSQGEMAQEHEGSGAILSVTYEEGKFGNEITELAGPIRNEAPAEAAERSADAGWNPRHPKQVLIVRQAAWKAVLGSSITHKLADVEPTPKVVFESLAPFVHAVELDIFRGWLGEDDIPF